MEAHNGLSARIAEEAGFRAIWASGLAISAALGVRDNNEASWTQVLEVVEFMSDATTVPILLDGDTGFGNFNNVRRLVRKLEQRGIAALCIEDKLFPKTSSFINGDRQPLADIAEFAGKIKAVKDAQQDSDFCLVARLEGFIAGWGVDEMLRRAEAYHAAGADALLVHSRRSGPEEVLAFARAWQGRSPIVIVPTTYYSTPAEVFEKAGIRLVIWANHSVRAAISAMTETTREIQRTRSVRDVEDRIAPVGEVFRLQKADELLQAEDRYLPRSAPAPRAIILAASQGTELGELTRHRPKAMVPIRGEPLLHRLVADLRSQRIKDVVVIRGFGRDEVNAPGARYVDNDDFVGTGELMSLWKALDHVEGPLVLCFGDILFRRYILEQLLRDPHDLVIVVDAAWRARARARNACDHVRASHPYSMRYGEVEAELVEMGRHLRPELVDGEWIGLARASAEGARSIRDALHELRGQPGFERMRMDDLFRRLLDAREPISIQYITGHWLDVDDLEDLSAANTF